MSVTLRKEVAEELITYKLRKVQEAIVAILSRWQENSAARFLERARDGHYLEAENDAIDLRQLLLDEARLKEILKDVEG